MSIQKTAEILKANIEASQALIGQLDRFAQPLADAATLIYEAIKAGGKLISCGNGGSAADSAHFSAEIAGRYVMERRGFPAIDLSSNASLVTALANDYPPQEVYARQVVALGAAGDVLAVFTTSGNSENITLALGAAKEAGIKTIAFLGRDGRITSEWRRACMPEQCLAVWEHVGRFVEFLLFEVACCEPETGFFGL